MNLEKLQIFFAQFPVQLLRANRLLCFPGVHGMYLPASWSGKYTNLTDVQVRSSDPSQDVCPKLSYSICLSRCKFRMMRDLNKPSKSTHQPTNAPNKIQSITSIKLLHVSAPRCHPQGVFYNEGIAVHCPNLVHRPNLAQRPYLVLHPSLD